MSQILITVVRDTLPPTVPTGLVATPVSGTRIDLTWSASSDSGGSGLKGYNVYRGATLIASQVQGLSYQDTGLTSGTSYGYRVSAIDNVGNESAQSSIAQATTLDSAAPSVPTGVSATPISSSVISVSWSASTDTGGSGLAGYRIFRDGVFVTQANGTTFTDTGRAASTLYSYRISAIDNALNESAQSTAATATTLAPSATGSPFLIATDILAGPTTGIENNKGAYLSIFGLNLGAQSALGVTTKVYLGTGGVWNEVDNYRALVPARGNPLLGAQELIVQIGSLGGAANGAVLNIKVVVAGVDSNTNLTFMINPGDAYHVDNVSGNEATGVKNDASHPWARLQNYPSGGSAAVAGSVWATGNLKAGDFIILHANSGTPYADQTGFDGRFMRFRLQSGSAPTGASGTGYITVQRYPGAALAHAPHDAYVKLPSGSRGGFFGAGSSNDLSGGGKYFVLSGIRVEGAATSASTDAGPINLQSGANNWRIINCDSSFPSTDTGTSHQRNGAIAGNGVGVVIMFCYLHDVYGDTSQENHGIYFDGSNTTAKNCTVAYNYIKNVTHGSLLQYYRTSSGNITGMVAHSNLMDGGGKYGVNFADGTESCDFYNNIVMNTFNYGCRFNTFSAPPSTAAINVLHNIFYNCKTGSAGYNSIVANEWNALVNVQIKHNIFCLQTGRASASTIWVNGNTGGMTIDRNEYFDYQGSLTTKHAGDSTGFYANPQFGSPGTDFTLGASSPAIDAATATLPISVFTDMLLKSRPQGAASDIGPLEKQAA
jgi:chitodextrinase